MLEVPTALALLGVSSYVTPGIFPFVTVNFVTLAVYFDIY